jgi:hypothetical protein
MEKIVEEMKSESGCDIAIKPSPTDASLKVAAVTGSREEVENTREELFEIIAEARLGTHIYEYEVPDYAVRELAKDETLDYLREMSGCKISPKCSNDSSPQNWRLLLIEGKQEEIENALLLIKNVQNKVTRTTDKNTDNRVVDIDKRSTDNHDDDTDNTELHIEAGANIDLTENDADFDVDNLDWRIASLPPEDDVEESKNYVDDSIVYSNTDIVKISEITTGDIKSNIQILIVFGITLDITSCNLTYFNNVSITINNRIINIVFTLFYIILRRETSYSPI